MKDRIKIIIILSLFVGIIGGSEASAQMVEIVHDKEKEKQIAAIENGKWDFGSKWYYYLLHNDYSGAEAGWNNWQLKVKFKEKNSNVKRIYKRRTASFASQVAKKESTETERKKIEELWKEDVANQADRMVDVTYNSYKEDFNELQDQINQYLTYCMTKSKGKMKAVVDRFVRKNDIICENIAYLHKQGPQVQLENSKRQKGYEEAYADMKTIAIQTFRLARIASTMY